MFPKISIATLFAGLAAAQIHAPVGNPSGNPITRPLNEVVPACKPFTITWQPTTPNTVSVLLLKGPATNVVKFGPSIAEGIANSGSLVWTPPATLDATAGPTGYGIQLIDDVTGQYQYSTQFGISKDGCAVVASSSAVVASSVKASSSMGGYPVSSTLVVSKASSTPCSTSVGTAVSSAKASSAPPYPIVLSTGAPMGNSSAIQPTKPITMPGSLQATATGPAVTSQLPQATGAASALQAGAGLVGAVAAFALML